MRDQGHYFPSLVAHGWAQPWPEMRAGWVQQLTHERGDVVLTDVYGAVCGVDVPLGEGRADRAGGPGAVGPGRSSTGRCRASACTPGLRLETQWPGVFATTTSTDDGQRALHVINTSGVTGHGDGRARRHPHRCTATLSVPPHWHHPCPSGLNITGDLGPT